MMSNRKFALGSLSIDKDASPALKLSALSDFDRSTDNDNDATTAAVLVTPTISASSSSSVAAATFIPQPGMTLQQIMGNKGATETTYWRWVQVFQSEQGLFGDEIDQCEMKMRELRSSMKDPLSPSRIQISIALYLLDRVIDKLPIASQALKAIRVEFLKAIFVNWNEIQNQNYFVASPYFSGRVSTELTSPVAKKSKQLIGGSRLLAAPIARIIRLWQQTLTAMTFVAWRRVAAEFKRNKTSIQRIIGEWIGTRDTTLKRCIFTEWRALSASTATTHAATKGSNSLFMADIKETSIYRELERQNKALETQLRAYSDMLRKAELRYNEEVGKRDELIESLKAQLEAEKKATGIIFSESNQHAQKIKYEKPSGIEVQNVEWKEWDIWMELSEERFLLRWINACREKSTEVFQPLGKNVDTEVEQAMNWNSSFSDSKLLILVMMVAGKVTLDYAALNVLEPWDRATEIVIQMQKIGVLELLTPEIIVNGGGDIMKCVCADMFVKFAPIMDPVFGGPSVALGPEVSRARAATMKKTPYASADSQLRAISETLRSLAWRINGFMWRLLRLKCGGKHQLPTVEINPAFYTVRQQTITELSTQRYSMRMQLLGSKMVMSEKAEAPESMKAEVESVLKTLAPDLKRVFDRYASREYMQFGSMGISAIGYRLMIKECRLCRGKCTIDFLEDQAQIAAEGSGKYSILSPALFVELLVRLSISLRPPDDPVPKNCSIAANVSKFITADLLPRYDTRPINPEFVSTVFNGDCRQVIQQSLKCLRDFFERQPLVGKEQKCAVDFAQRRAIKLSSILKGMGISVDKPMKQTLEGIAASCGKILEPVKASSVTKETQPKKRMVKPGASMTFAAFVEAICAVAISRDTSPYEPNHKKIANFIQMIPSTQHQSEMLSPGRERVKS